MKKILIIQTAFIGDAVLATALVEQIKSIHPDSEIHFLLRKGNQDLLKFNSNIKKIWIWDKANKYKSLFYLVKKLRKINFDYLFNLQRYFNSGLMMALIKSRFKSCFSQNPLSFFATKNIKHQIPYYKNNELKHEIDRNTLLLPNNWEEVEFKKPKLYFHSSPPQNFDPYVVLAPNSVWYTKQWPKESWKQLASQIVNLGVKVHFIGAPGDFDECEELRVGIEKSSFNHCGSMSLHDSAHLMRSAIRVFANDSAALHLASSVNTPSTAIFCSTTKKFGFYGVSDDAQIFEVLDLDCKPCGLHGKKECPHKHFNCSNISVDQVFKSLGL